MPSRLLLVLLTGLALAGCQQSTPPVPAATPVPTAQPRSVLGAEARALIGTGALLIDVRTADEFNELHLEGARNIPLHELTRAMSSLPKDKPVIVYCAVGSRSATAAGLLAKSGYDVRNLGAMENWKR